MTLYRGMEVPKHLCSVLPYMAMVDECRESLQILSQQWDYLDVLSRVIDADIEMTRTRFEFRALNSDLVAALGDEILKKVTASLGAKAQVTIDIIVRNLFERTADIGFLATDDDVRAFLKNERGLTPDVIRARLVEYQRKYSVYDDVVVLDAHGQIRANAFARPLPETSRDGLIERALTTRDAFVETFATSDLAGHDARCLTYAYRIGETSDPSSRALGVLVLMFGFDSEMRGIFDKLASDDDWSVLTLLDGDGTVIASSDTEQVAVGTRLKTDATQPYEILRHAGRRYIAVTHDTKGYQGYFGPGWRGCALIPAELAFEQDEDSADLGLSDRQFRAIAQNEHLLSNTVREIPRRAEAIQSDLNRTVWNGSLAASHRQVTKRDGTTSEIASHTLLAEISETGSRTSRIFAGAVAALNRTAVGSILTDAAASADLALDIMDRNLYERANDCRWWALTTRFREILAQATIDDDDARELTSILAYINGLYTVYTNLILFDRNGRIAAVSDPEQTDLVGTAIDAELVRRFASTADTNFYGVSDFAASPLYAGRHTYVYGAAVLHPEEQDRIVGGIAIVFDSTPQFEAMLADASPTDGAGNRLPGCRTLFLDSERNLIASTDGGDAAGSATTLPAALFEIAPGESTARIIALDGRLIAVGVSRSHGYREYKSAADAYRNDVYCLCQLDLGIDDATAAAIPTTAQPLRGGAGRRDGDLVEVATFRVGGKWLALERASAVEAILPEQLLRFPHQHDNVVGCVVHKGESVVIVDLRRQFEGAGRDDAKVRRPVVLFRNSNGRIVGLQVDELGDVRSVDSDRLDGARFGGQQMAVKAVIALGTNAESATRTMALLLDPDELARYAAAPELHDQAAA